MKDLSIPKETRRKNNAILPRSIRACIIGKSGCGKTNLLMNLLLDNYNGTDYLDYDNLYIFGKSLHQPEYQFLINCVEHRLSKSEILDSLKSKTYDIVPKNADETIKLCYFENSCEVPDPKELDSNTKNLIIFDDVMLDKQTKIEDYYTRGRHNNVDCFYISQNYATLPRHTIRENANLFILFPQDQLTLEHFHRDHCTDIDIAKFKSFCDEVYKIPYSFVTIDLNKHKYSGKYRKNLNKIFIDNPALYHSLRPTD